MAIVKVGDINIEYYVEGSGPPLLMIMGLGGQASSWGEPVLEGLQRNFTTIRFSNRGTGATDKPADAAGLMESIGIEKAHVFGISMGGMIAQELVLNHPQRVQGLVLGCTNCGPAHSVTVPAETLNRFGQIMSLPVEERIREFWNVAVTPQFIEGSAAFLDHIMEIGMVHPTPMETFGRQFAAIQAFDSYDRLPQIKSPTLIIQGDMDALVPAENAQVLHDRIPGSRVRIVQGTGHCFFWEQPEEVVEEIVAFLSKVAVGA